MKIFLVLVIMGAVIVLGVLAFVFGTLQKQDTGTEPVFASETALRLLNIESCRSGGVAEQYRSCDMEIKKEGDRWIVTVTHDGFFDDSVKASQVRAVVRHVNGTWVLIEKTEMQQCWPGRGHQDFSQELCV